MTKATPHVVEKAGAAHLAPAKSKPNGASALEQMQPIAMEDLRPAPWNARKTQDPAKLAELVQSIRDHGIQSPLIVRSFKKRFRAKKSDAGDRVWHLVCENIIGRDNIQETFSHGTPAENQAEAEAAAARENGPGSYEIVAGHRRFAALQELRYTDAPCIVRELTDEQAQEIGLVDNLQREDVPAMEEAESLGELLDQLHSVATVAARVGKEQAYIAKRLKLRSCTEHTRRALAERLITVDHALLLARLGEDEQNEALKWTLDKTAGSKTSVESVLAKRLEAGLKNANAYFGRVWEPETVQKLKEHIEDRSGILLSRAPWDLDDVNLVPDAGACNACPQNTKANAPLFGDLEIGEATCTDGGCFKEKTQGFVRIQARACDGAQAPLRVSWKATSTAPRMEKDGSGPSLTQIFKDGQWVEAKKNSCEHVRAAVTVDWSDANNRGFMGDGRKLRKPGEITQVCVAPKCKKHPKEYGKPQAQRPSGERWDPVAEAAKRKAREEECAKENKLRVAFVAKALDGITEIPADTLRGIMLSADRHDGRVSNAILPGFDKILKSAKTDSPQFAKAAVLVAIESKELQAWPYFRTAKDDKKSRDRLIKSIRALGYSGSTPWDEATKTEPAKKGQRSKPVKLSASAKKRIADAVKKRWKQTQEAKKAAAKPPAKKGGRK